MPFYIDHSFVSLQIYLFTVEFLCYFRFYSIDMLLQIILWHFVEIKLYLDTGTSKSNIFSFKKCIFFNFLHYRAPWKDWYSLVFCHKNLQLRLHNEGLFVCLLGFNARAVVFQLYSGDEHELDDKMNMKWWWNEKGMGHKDNGVDKFWLPLEIGGGG